jgi:hypothetical protein
MTTNGQINDFYRGEPDDELWPYEETLAHNIRDFVAELCLVDAGILISDIYGNRHANIDDLVNSSAELFFKENTLNYGYAADVSFEWGKSPTVMLDMEFAHSSANVFFKLILHGYYVGIAIQRILLDNQSGDRDLDLMHFGSALSEARLVPLMA